MAKKQSNVEEAERQRRTRKEVLLARKQSRQNRQVWIGVGIVAGLLAIVVLIAIVNEFFIAPNRPVAIVSGTEITLSEWQERVRFERAQRILLLENQLEAFQGNVGIVQQFAGQTINELLAAEQLGQAVLNQMIDEVIIRQTAEARGITVTDADVDAAIGETFNYFGGELPTPQPTATATVEPTPSLTPIPTAVITDVVPTNTPLPTATMGPTAIPSPTATPVSEAAFQEQFSDLVADFEALGVDEATYREYVRTQLYRERLREAIAEERNVATEAEQASVFVLTYNTEEEANEALAVIIEEEGFLNVWNAVRSLPPDAEEGMTGTATEQIWRTQEALASTFGEEVAAAAFELPIGEPSDILIQQSADGTTTRYIIIQVSGREVRDLTQAQIQEREREALESFIDEQLTGNLTLTEYDRGRVPTQPILDPIFTTPPTATPAIQPTQPTP